MATVDFGARMKDAEKAGLLSGGDYLKLKEGGNRMRIVSEPLPHEGEFQGKRNFKWLVLVLDRGMPTACRCRSSRAGNRKRGRTRCEMTTSTGRGGSAMGQHKRNPTALAAARGELSKVKRSKEPKRDPVFVVAGGEYVNGRSVKVVADRDSFKRFIGRVVKTTGARLERALPKVRGKAAVKAAKRLRMAALKVAA